jgi:hypothetical protein
MDSPNKKKPAKLAFFTPPPTMHKTILLSLITFHSYGQSVLVDRFDREKCQFMADKIEQAKFLLRPVLPLGIIGKQNLAKLPVFLDNALSGKTALPSVDSLKNYCKKNGIDVEHLGGNLDESIATNSKNVKAKYLVIHDTSSPEIAGGKFSDEIDSPAWVYNQPQKVYQKKDTNKVLAHAFIGRTGISYSQIGFKKAWRATKFEKLLGADLAKGLFIHIELVQPRTNGDKATFFYAAPSPGFTELQYKRLALMYLCASVRAKEWMIPTYHCVLDEGFPDGHDDPQNFSLDEFCKQIEKLVEKL